MGDMMWCPLCKRNIQSTKNFNWVAFIFLGGLIYWLWFKIFKSHECPICQSKNLMPARLDEQIARATK